MPWSLENANLQLLNQEPARPGTAQTCTREHAHRHAHTHTCIQEGLSGAIT